MDNKILLKKIILNGSATEKKEANLPANVYKLIENEFILNALRDNDITISDILNCSDLTLKAINYPSIKKCLWKKKNLFSIFNSKFCVKKIFEIKTQEELASLLCEAQKMTRRSILSIFQVPTHLHDEIHELKEELLHC